MLDSDDLQCCDLAAYRDPLHLLIFSNDGHILESDIPQRIAQDILNFKLILIKIVELEGAILTDASECNDR